jgi:peptidoglycan/LPS O-acetylase OafA/YrhL
MRAVAVLMVFVFHAARPALPGGFIGVDVFFVLSGYLITRILITRAEQTGRVGFVDFYARRVRRLMPAVILLVLGITLREAVWGSILELATRIREALAALFYYANWNLIAQADEYFLEGAAPSPLRHTWSLSVEEQFYVMWPLVLMATLAWAKSRRARIIAVGGLVVVSAVAMGVLFDPAYVTRAYYGTDARIQQPLMGALLAFWWHGREVPGWLRRTGPWFATAGLVALVVVASLISGDSVFYYLGGSTLIAVLTALVIAGVEARPDSHISRGLGWSPLRDLGKISYGYYLWHWPVILWITAPTGADFFTRRVVNLTQALVTLALAVTSYVLVETPIRERRWAFALLGSRATIAAGVACLGLTAGITAAALWPTAAGTANGQDVRAANTEAGPDDTTTRLSQAARDEIAAAAIADPSVHACPDQPEPCLRVQGVGNDPVTLVLVGDSTAQHYDPGLQLLAEDHGFTYVQAAIGGCPLGHRLIATGIDGQLHKPSNYMCYEVLPGLYQSIVDDWDPDIILATSYNETSRHIGAEGSVVETGTSQHLADTEDGLRQAISTLTRRGATLVFIDILPGGVGVACLDAGGPEDAACNREVARESREMPYNTLFGRLAADLEQVEHISLADKVCPADNCPLMIDGVVVRYDGGHLTGTESRLLAPTILDRLAQVGVQLGGST